MHYSIELEERRYVKGYGFLSFAKNIGKSPSNNYGQKLVDRAKKSATDALKTAGKTEIQKTSEATGRNKIADKITCLSKKSPDHPTALHSNQSNNEIPKERYIFLQERQQIIDELRLI